MLKEIQALEFVAIELNQNLDTHPGDRAALRDFYTIRDKLFAAIECYEKDVRAVESLWRCAYVNTPWPWIEDPGRGKLNTNREGDLVMWIYEKNWNTRSGFIKTISVWPDF